MRPVANPFPSLSDARRWACAALGLLAVAGPVAASDAPAGRWRVHLATTAPWHSGPMPDMWLDRTGFIISSGGLTGEGAFTCPEARFERLKMPVEGLFEGMLPTDKAVGIARDLGLRTAGDGAITWRVGCTNASFDLHMIGEDRLTFAIDNVIYLAHRFTAVSQLSDADFRRPAWPAIDCVSTAAEWQKIVCDDPETSAAHAALVRVTTRATMMATGDAAERITRDHQAFLATAARNCRAESAPATPAEAAEKAACLANAYEVRLIDIRTNPPEAK